MDTTTTLPAPAQAAIGHNSGSYLQLLDADPALLYRDPDPSAALDKLCKEIEASLAELEVDLTSSTGRKAIASAAAQIARRKVAIDEAGKGLTEEYRRKTEEINVVRRGVRERLDDLRDSAREPLTKWEEAEKAREEKIKCIIDALERAALPLPADTPTETIDERLEWVRGVDVSVGALGAFAAQADAFKERAIEHLTGERERAVARQREQAELERLRAAERERQERERQAEAQRRQEEAERERVAAAERRAAEEAAAAERRAAEARIAEERRQREEAERRLREEQERAEREARERAAREADQRHRETILQAATDALAERARIRRTVAEKIMLEIAAGNVPRVKIEF